MKSLEVHNYKIGLIYYAGVLFVILLCSCRLVERSGLIKQSSFSKEYHHIETKGYEVFVLSPSFVLITTRPQKNEITNITQKEIPLDKSKNGTIALGESQCNLLYAGGTYVDVAGKIIPSVYGNEQYILIDNYADVYVIKKTSELHDVIHDYIDSPSIEYEERMLHEIKKSFESIPRLLNAPETVKETQNPITMISTVLY